MDFKVLDEKEGVSVIDALIEIAWQLKEINEGIWRIVEQTKKGD